MKATTILSCFMTAVMIAASPASAASLVTTDPAAVTVFQSGHTVLGFDEMPGNGGGGGAGNTGTAIEPASQLTDNYLSVGVRFSSTGGPVGVVSVQGLSNQGDAKSPYNIIGGSIPHGSVPVLDYFSPIRLTFVCPGTMLPTVAERVGAWNDPTGSLIRLEVFDAGGALLESVEANQGFFIGIQRAGIASAVFSHVRGSLGFSLDDVTFSSPASLLPRLRIGRAGTNVILSWPGNLENNFLLEAVGTLGEAWTVVPDTPVIAGSDQSVILPSGAPSRFYRLKKQ